MSELDIAALQGLHELHIMIPRNAECVTSLHHFGDQTKDLRCSWTSVYEITDEDQLSTFRSLDNIPLPIRIDCVTKLAQQFQQLVDAAMHITDDVKWTMLSLAIIPERLSFDRHGIDIFGRGQPEDVANSFAVQPAQAAPKLLALVPNHVRAELTIQPRSVAFMTELLGQIENGAIRAV
jgi:hypothetical protein